MSQLGPVIGNRITNARKSAPSPHLQARLAAKAVRATHGGLMLRGGDGRLSFVPGGLPLPPTLAAPRQGPVRPACPAEGDDVRAVMAGDSAATAFDPYKRAAGRGRHGGPTGGAGSAAAAPNAAAYAPGTGFGAAGALTAAARSH